MIIGTHTIVYTSDASATRAFFREVLGFSCVDAGHGWLIFALPPGEVGFHPVDEQDGSEESDAAGESGEGDAGHAAGPGPGRHELYFLCDDVSKTMAELSAKGVEFTSPVMDRGWGLLTSMRVPGAGTMHLYQPRHPMAIG